MVGEAARHHTQGHRGLTKGHGMFDARGRNGAAVAVAAVACSLAAASAGAAASTWKLRFSFLPQRAYQGQSAAVSVLVKPADARCTLAVRFADGSRQPGLAPVRAAQGRASWTLSLAQSTVPGAARATVSCGPSGTLSRTFTVVGGTVRHSKLAITAQGFSQRPDPFGAGSTVSYGVVLDNPSSSADAQSVTVLVNFLDASDHVLQSASTNVPAISAASSFDVGGNASLPTTTPVSRLEIVVQTGSYALHKLHIPAVDNVQIVPSTYDPGWVGGVNGELVNDHPTDVLMNAQLSIVLYNATGQVIGGGTGLVFNALPPGTRSFFSATNGFSAVPIQAASTAAVSIEPTYKAPGT